MGKIISNVIEPFTGAKAMQKAANEQAAQQREAAAKAGAASRFQPVGMTTTFGTSNFREEVDPLTGIPRIVEAGYTANPEISALQSRLFGMAPGALGTAEAAQMAAMPIGAAAQQAFGLGSQYLSESPEAARQRYFNQQQALLEQPRQQEEQRLASTVFGRGRAGLNIAGMGQPELYSLANARRQQDLQLAAQAEQAAQQQATFGTNLFGTGASLLGQQYGIPTQALGPLQSYLGTIGELETMAQQPFQLGMQVGAGVTQGGQVGGGLLQAGLNQAASAQAAGATRAAQANAAFMQQMLKSAVGGSFGGGGGSASAGFNGQPGYQQYLEGYGGAE